MRAQALRPARREAEQDAAAEADPEAEDRAVNPSVIPNSSNPPAIPDSCLRSYTCTAETEPAWWVVLVGWHFETVLRACHGSASAGKGDLFSRIDRWGLRWVPSVLWCLLSGRHGAARQKDIP
ncbi:hypothetical protein K0U83_09655 [bacterium]|nr:hypothetical protein [bacterium]